MTTIDLLRHSGTHLLGTRPVARDMKPAMRAALENGTVTLDGSVVRRISVSFFDESLLILNELIAETGNSNLRLIYRNAPRPESLKTLVPNRGLTLSESPTGDWIITSRR